MKVGDKIPVNIGNHEVAQAEVKEINGAEAVLIVPARRVVMGIRTELTDLPGTQPETETIITGVDRPEATAPVVEQPNDTTVPPADSPGVADAVAPVQPPQAVETPAPVVEAPETAPVTPVESAAPVTPPENAGA